MALSLFGKLSVSMAFSSIYVYSMELFPTGIRHRILAGCSMVGRLGQLAAPLSPLLVSITVASAAGAQRVFAFGAKLCISMVFASVYIYTMELFPTLVRHTLVGLCSTVGRVGCIVAPLTPLLVGQSARRLYGL